MRRIDYLLAEKIGFLINLGLYRLVKPDFNLRDVTSLNRGTIRWIKQKYGIEGIVLDVDETLKIFGSKIPEYNKEWLEDVRDELKVAILSNGWNKEMEEYCQERGIEYIKLGFKPAKGGFKKACKSMDLDPSKVMMIGNDLFADIYGGKRSKLRTAHVRGIGNDGKQR